MAQMEAKLEAEIGDREAQIKAQEQALRTQMMKNTSLAQLNFLVEKKQQLKSSKSSLEQTLTQKLLRKKKTI